MATDTLEQDIISNTYEIFSRIKSELLKARFEILVAMAWFTDNELFEILMQKRGEGILVYLILSNQPDNEKLDFEKLNRSGGEMIKINNVGYGIMNQKFCVIDRQISISGSYNWSINAKTNNHENVLITNDAKTVQNYVHIFFNLRHRAAKLKEGMEIEDVKNIDPNTVSIPDLKSVNNSFPHTPALNTTNSSIEEQKISFHEHSLNEFKSVLDHIIATEVGSFNRQLLKDSGYNRAAENNGDHQVIAQAMDSLYSSFINEIEVIDEKKKRLKGKIEEQQKVSIANVDLKTENEINTLKNNLLVETQNTEESIAMVARGIDSRLLTIASNTNTRIPFIEEKINSLRAKISTLKAAFVKPPINWPLMISLSLIGLLLIAYIFVFYSSVAYIFIFSKEDIKRALLSGAPIIEMPEVFNAHAITKILHKGLGGILFTFLFVAIPLALGMFKIFFSPIDEEGIRKDLEIKKQRSWYRNFFMNYGGVIFIIGVDIFIAFKVARNINEIEYLINTTDTKLAASQIIWSENFWLVFALGSLGVYLFTIVFNKFMELMNIRNTTFQQQKIKFEVSEMEKAIECLKVDINVIKIENDDLNKERAGLEKEKKEKEQNLRDNPILHNQKVNQLQHLLLSYKERLINISNIYRSQIDNDKLPVSKAEMENRINIFMEGWSKYLNDTYSVARAEVKTREAINESELWLSGLSVTALGTADLKHNVLNN